LFSNQFPYFKKGNILKKSMLENIRDYPRDFINLYFQDYSDGILTGCSLEVKGNYININRGLIKFKDRMYMLNEVSKVDYEDSSNEMILKVKFLDSKEENDFEIYESNIYLDTGQKLEESEFELGRFKFRKGAQLRDNYNQFTDFAIEYNTINLINVKYSSVSEPSIHPLISKMFAHQVLDNIEDSSLDISFAMQCLSNKVVNRKLIMAYLVKKLGLEDKAYTNMEIYRFLRRILKLISGNISNGTQARNRPNKIIVD